MPSRTQYDLVSDDGCDSRIPMHNEDAFKHGITFQAKYVGTLDVPRPQSRVEIVAAMRRIRFEFKAKAVKKRKIIFTISVDGVTIVLRRKRSRNRWRDGTNQVLMHHPIYRIFYVSHDSQDLKIFSYIARDSQTNIFKCNVFKAYKKAQAMRIVRSVGQAFEVCHKLTLNKAESDAEAIASGQTEEKKIEELRNSTSQDSGSMALGSSAKQHSSVGTLTSPVSPLPPLAALPFHHSQIPQALTSDLSSVLTSASSSTATGGNTFNTPLAAFHAAQLTRQQLEQQTQQTQVAIAQVHLLKDQLSAETAARIEAQARVHQLLVQNRELLDHLNQIVHRVRQLESNQPASDGLQLDFTMSTSNSALLSHLYQQSIGEKPESESALSNLLNNNCTIQNGVGSTNGGETLSGLQPVARCGPVILPAFGAVEAAHMTPLDEVRPPPMFENMSAAAAASDDCLADQEDKSQDSPDSGHKEMSTDSIAAEAEATASSFSTAYRPSSLSWNSARLSSEWPPKELALRSTNLLPDFATASFLTSGGQMMRTTSPSETASNATHISSLNSLCNSDRDINKNVNSFGLEDTNLSQSNPFARACAELNANTVH